MLYLRNTNQQQTLDRGIKRGITNLCCTPTLNSVTTASLTELTVNGTFGTYLINCKSCVGGYIQVTENSGSSWTTINPGNCSVTNLVPMPSQSAYYRLFTSCSSNNQPFDPLTSDYSNEILFVPNGYVNYNFVEDFGATGQFKLYKNEELAVNVSSSVIATYWNMPSASMATASVQVTNVPITGSTSMSLWVTGSNVNYYTSSCFTSGGIFLDSWKIIPNEFYNVTASVNFRPENNCSYLGNSGSNSAYIAMGYLVNSYDESNSIWYHTNGYGVADTSGLYPSASITGSARKTNVLSGDCRYNAIQFSGSLTLPIPAGSPGYPYSEVYMSIITGSFRLSGESGGYGWYLNVKYQESGSIEVPNYSLVNATVKNACIGLQNNQYVSPFGHRTLGLYVSGSQIANNPPYWDGNGDFGPYLTLTGEGIIRAFGYGYYGKEPFSGLGNQSLYDCIYDTTPSK